MNLDPMYFLSTDCLFTGCQQMKFRLAQQGNWRATQFVAVAVGAAALGTLAIGAIAIGTLAIGGIVVRKARFQTVEIDDLTVHRLHVLETAPNLPQDVETEQGTTQPP
jgi:hypothetical protein